MKGLAIASVILAAFSFVSQSVAQCVSGSSCTFTDFNGDSFSATCSPGGVCGGAGATCGNDNGCVNLYSNGCAGGVCGGQGAYCTSSGDCSSTTSCTFLTRTCDACPSGSSPTTGSDGNPSCDCSTDQPFTNFNTYLGQCVCPDSSYSNTPSTCSICPSDTYGSDASNPAACTCVASGTEFVITNGVGECQCVAGEFRQAGDPNGFCTSCPPTATTLDITTTMPCSCPGAGEMYSFANNDCYCTNSNQVLSYNNDGTSQCANCPDNASAVQNGDFTICECNADFLANYDPNSGALTCVACPSGGTSSVGDVTCQCPNSGIYQPGTNTCVSCPGGSSYVAGVMDGPPATCRCDSPNYYIPSSNMCTPCPSGSTPDSFDGTTCDCSTPYSYFDKPSSSCICGGPSGDGVCTCPGKQYISSQTGTCVKCPPASTKDPQYQSCVCRNANKYFDPVNNKCSKCPRGSSIAPGMPSSAYTDPNQLTCLCEGANTSFNTDTNMCQCYFDAFAPDGNPNDGCVVCGQFSYPSIDGSGTVPNTCTCQDTRATYDQSTNTCDCPMGEVLDPIYGTCGLATSTVGRSKQKRAQGERQMLISSYQRTPWQELESHVLCAGRNETACPLATKIFSYECLDTFNDPESCGGCVSTGHGVNCWEKPGVFSATCIEGICTNYRCESGWTAVEGIGCKRI